MSRERLPLLPILLVSLSLRDGTSVAGEDTKPVAPARESRARLVVQTGHSNGVSAVAFSPDGKLVLTGSFDQTPRLWDVQSGRLLHTLQGHTKSVTNVAFSSNGKLVLTGSGDTTARLWDVQSGKLLHTLQGHSDWVHGVAFSPDSKLVVTGNSDKTARLWDVQSGKLLHTLQGHTRYVTSVAFSPDGKLVLTGSGDTTARLWDVQSGKQINILQAHGGDVSSVAFSPDGKLVLTGSNDYTARLWEVQSGKQLHTLLGHKLPVNCVAFSPDGKLVLTGSGDQTARLWDVQSGKLLHTLQGHTLSVTSVAFNSDGKLVLTGSLDKTARLWDVQSGKLLHILQGRITFDWSVASIAAFSPDGKLVLTGRNDDTAAQLWEVHSGKLLHTLQGQTNSVQCVAFSPDAKLVLTGSTDHNARLWDVQSGKLLLTLQGHKMGVRRVAFSPDGKLVLTGSDDYTARLWEVQSGKQLHLLRSPTGNVTDVAFGPDGKLVVIGRTDNTAQLWDVQSGKLLHTLQGHTGWVHSAAFSPDSKLVVTGSSDKSARLWDVQSGKLLHTLQGHTLWVMSVAFSPDSKLVLTGSSDKSARLWDVQSGKLLHTLQGHTGYVMRVAFSPDGKLALTGSADQTARLWDVQNGKLFHSLQGHTSDVRNAAFSPDGKLVLTGSADQTARLWDVQSGKQLHLLEGHTNELTSVVFSADGKLIVTGSMDKTTLLWEVQSGQELCALVSFTDGSWAVVDPEGRYDASNGGDVDGLHWVVGLEPIALKQLKERYYEPGLLAKHLGYNKEPLRKVETFRDVKLYPAIAVAQKDPKRPQLDVTLTNRGGGIGRVVVLVNGKEVTPDLRPHGASADAAKLALQLDLSHDPRLIPGAKNKVEVLAFNGEGYLASRGFELEVVAPGKALVELPTLHAIVVGIGDYRNEKLKLRYPAKDAEDFATALQLGGKRLFGAEKVHLALLTTADHPGTIRPTKENIAKAFAELKKAKPVDIVVVYLAGHGVALQQGKDLYCYATADARTIDPVTLNNDPALREATTVSSEELAEWTRQIPALKQVMVLDTCAAGAAAVKLTEKRDVSGDQIRAIERLKDRTGFHVLMGCAADRVSYEASQYAQGLLTYSLLEGMRGTALREGEFVDVSKLFRYAEDRVPELSRNIGGVQRPLVAAPRGSSFDVGQLATEDRAKVPLALVKPLVLKPVLINRDADEDDLKLTVLLRERLSEASRPVVRGKAPAIVYVPEDDFPGAVRPTGTYGVDGDKVSVRLTLKRDGVVIARPMVEGRKSDLPALAEKLAQAVLAAAK